MRIGFFDGEMSNLKPDFGQLLCFGIGAYNDPEEDPPPRGWKPWKGLKVIKYTRDEYMQRTDDVDKRLLQKTAQALSQFDILVSWNGIQFDIPFIESRLMWWNLPPLTIPAGRHRDLMYTARYKMHLSSARLDNVAQHLRVYEKYGCKKTKMDSQRWIHALWGGKKGWPSYQYIVDHNIEDIKVLAAVWHESRHLVNLK